MNSCVFISVDGVSTRKDAPIKTIKYYQTWGGGSGSYTIFIEKVVSSEEADASEKAGEADATDDHTTSAETGGYRTGLLATSCHC
jgi:hypothetical protein